MSRSGNEILNLMMPMFSGTKDDYGKEVVPPIPLAFDRVNEGGHPTFHQSLLFQLPFEILANVLENLSPDSLASLALVCRDCRQLARSKQFTSIKLDYSLNASALLEKLLAEMLIRKTNSTIGPANMSQSIGACIRRITVASQPGWITYRHGVSLGEHNFQDLPEEEQRKRMVEASGSYFGDYLVKLQMVLSDKRVLPNLELLDWEDIIKLTKPFFDGLVISNLQHLKLFRVAVGEEFMVHLLNRSLAWRLKTLHLELNPDFQTDMNTNIAPLSASILLSCASTLESLTWVADVMNRNKHSFSCYTAEEPEFPQLRRLRVSHVKFFDTSPLKALVSDRLRALEVNTNNDDVTRNFFESRGNIPALETFAWDLLLRDEQEHPSFAFLQANDQLSKLSVHWAVPNRLIEYDILPRVTTHFGNLTSLCLRWTEKSIPKSALTLVGSLTALQQLHLSAGCEVGWRHEWEIEHRAMRKLLENLKGLRKLAFSRDTYDNGIQWCSPERYYEDRFTSDLPLRLGEERWELRHKIRMLVEGEKYREVFPVLEWLYFGQITMGVKADKLVVLLDERDDCCTYLRELFGWGSI